MAGAAYTRTEPAERDAIMKDEPTRLHRAERALLDSESRMQQVLDNTSAVMFAKDSLGRYVFANREFERVPRASTITGTSTGPAGASPGGTTNARRSGPEDATDAAASPQRTALRAVSASKPEPSTVTV